MAASSSVASLTAILSRAVLLKELFVQHLALASFNHGSGKESNSLSYSDLAHTAEKTETFHFLTGEVLPGLSGL